MKRVLVGASAALMCLAAASAALAQSDPKTALAERLVAALQLETTYHNMVGQASVGLAEQSGLRPQSEAAQRAVIDSLNESLGQATGDARPVVVAAVARTFTVDELQAAVAFFESPQGHAFNSKYPALEDALGQNVGPSLEQVLGPWEQSFCQKTACTAADHQAFATMRQNLRAGPPQGAPQQQ